MGLWCRSGVVIGCPMSVLELRLDRLEVLTSSVLTDYRTAKTITRKMALPIL